MRKVVLTGLFCGTATGLGFLMSGVPNFELITLVCVLAGAVLGARLGFLAGAMAEAVYSLASPYGVPLPPLLIAQTLAMGTAGLVGGLTAGMILRALRGRHTMAGALLSMCFGLGVTLVFDLLTNYGIVLGYGLDARVVFVQAIPFALIHMAGNGALFLVIYPLLLVRMAGLTRSSLRGGVFVPTLVIAGFLSGAVNPTSATAQAHSPSPEEMPGKSSVDSMVLAATESEPLPLDTWIPFVATLVDQLEKESPLVPVVDGGFGARVVLLHESGTSPVPVIVRDDIRLGTGHRWASDLWTVATMGQQLQAIDYGADGFGGLDGIVRFAADESQPGDTVVDAHFRKGSHESYLRGFAFRTPLAPWRLRFDFEESIDQGGYNFWIAGDERYGAERSLSAPQYGESRCRSGRGTLERNLPGGSLKLSIEKIRKHKTDLPAAGLDHEEVWADQVALIWRARLAGGELKTSFFWNGYDVAQWSPSDERKIETGREGTSVKWQRGGLSADATVDRWRLQDSGADPAWAGAGFDNPVNGDGTESSLGAACRLAVPFAPVSVQTRIQAFQAEQLGWRPGASLTMARSGLSRWWELSLEYGGRAPRSDELLTVERFVVPGQEFVLRPNAGLEAEKTVRCSALLQGRAGGIDFAARGTRRWLTHGIGFAGVTGSENTYGLTNDLQINGSTLVCSAAVERDLCGKLRVQCDATMRSQEITQGRALFLAPEQSAGLAVFWSHECFSGDGRVEIGYFLDHRGEMSDPWFPGAGYALPARNRHDLLVGFRLLDADLTMEFRNLTDEMFRMSAGAVAPGREVFYRLEWRLLQ